MRVGPSEDLNETGSIPVGSYWSSSQDSTNYAWDQRFSDGHQGENYDESNESSLRCVR